MELTPEKNRTIAHNSTPKNNQTVKGWARPIQNETWALWEQKWRMGSSQLQDKKVTERKRSFRGKNPTLKERLWK